MTDKTYLQALTDAKNAAEQAKQEAAERAMHVAQTAKSAKELDEQRWNNFRFLLNEQAGEFNAVKDQTGVFINGQVRPDLQFGTPHVCYEMRSQATAAQICMTFFQEKDNRSKVDLHPSNTRNVAIIEVCLTDRKIPCSATAVKNLFIELASVMVAI